MAADSEGGYPMTTFLRALGQGVAVAAICATATPAAAQQGGYQFDIPAQGLASALRAFAHVAHQQVTFAAGAVRGRRAPALRGRYSAEQALGILLAGSGLTVERGHSGVFIVHRGASSAPTAHAPAGDPPGAGGGLSDNLPQPEIVVTGSRLRASSFDSPTPVAEIEREDLIEDGYLDIADALDDIPGVDQSSALSNNQDAIQANGLSTISLRGLGSNRTLTLIDGHRTVSNAGNGNVVSLSSIPEYFLDRVEVTTGGASAVYGSDAISGVVNAITAHFDGVRARVVGSATWHGGGDNVEYSAGVGHRFFDNRLYVMAGVTYEKQYILRATDRDFALDSVTYDFEDNSVSRPDLSSNIPGGRFNSNDFYYDETGLHEDFVTAVNGYEDRLSRTLITPRERLNAAGKLDYDFSDHLRFSAEYIYSRVVTNSVAEPESVSYSSDYGPNGEFEVGRINRSNPYVPDVIADDSSSSGVKFYRRMTEVGARHRYNRRITNRAWAGLSGDLFDGWDWHLTYGFGAFDQYQSRTNYLNLQNLAYAVKAERASDGTIQCIDAAARADGCVPIDLFGIGAVTPEMADYIRADSEFFAHNRQHVVEGYITGSPFSLPAGPVDIAAGFEWRRDRTSSMTDPLTQTGLTSASYIPDFTGEVEAREAYLEARVPLLRDVPFAYRLSVDGAVRVANYDIPAVGTTVSFRGGGQWAPVRGLNFRGNFSRAQRAPDTTELFSPARDDYDDVIDICRNVTATTAGVVAQNCRADPGIAAAIAAAPDGKFTQISTEVFAPNSGNPNLREETANTLTFGVVLTPRFLPGFQLSVDYYDIRIRNAISSLDNNQLLLECYSDPNGPTNRFCDAVRRDSEGQLSRILNQDENLNRLRATGIDVAAAYRFDLGRIGLPGRLDLTARYTHRIRLQTRFEGFSGVETSDEVGEVGVSRDEARLGIAWNGRALSLRWSVVYLGPVVDSHEMAQFFAENGITDPLFLNVPAFWRHDFGFKFYPSRHNPRLKIFGNMRNVFNDHGPFLPDGTDSGSALNYSSVYDVRGRTVQMGVEVEF
jgi:outer membrane receptor protein involved in Fe transport